MHKYLNIFFLKIVIILFYDEKQNYYINIFFIKLNTCCII